MRVSKKNFLTALILLLSCDNIVVRQLVPSPEEITRVLKEFKVRMEQKNGFIFLSFRGVNRDTLSYLCIQPAHVKEIIAVLTYQDYSEGPIISDDPKLGNLWVFGSSYNGQELYIKISDNFSYDKARCISFHFPCQKMTFPYRGTQTKEAA